MLKCRIISVNEPTNFGHTVDENGNRTRYLQRRSKIDQFINTFKDDLTKIDYFNAITPNNFNFTTTGTGPNAPGYVYFDNKQLSIIGDCDLYIANTLSHYEIWKIDEDTLVFEDDVLFDKVKIKNIISIIDEFKKIPIDGKILYLQLSVPWSKNAHNKTFNLEKTTENIGKYKSGDISGTACYFITKECKRLLLNNMRPIVACDRYLDLLSREGILQYYLPLDKNKMFCLDTETFWL